MKRVRLTILGRCLGVCSFLLVVCLTQSVVALDAGGTGQADLLKEANEMFRQAGEQSSAALAEGLYQKALARFERLAKDGVRSGQLFYNIGNTYFQLNDIGRAVLNYRRAEQYIPNDENLRHNLQYVLSLQPDKIELNQEEQILKTLLFWHYDLSVYAKMVCLALFNALFWGMMTYKWWRKSSGLRLSLALTLLVCLMLSGSLLYGTSATLRQGVLVASEVVARNGDGNSYSPSFEAPLHAGLDFRLVQQRSGWLQIELKDGRRCWIPEEAAALVDG